MPKPRMRFFPNKLKDYNPGQDVEISKEKWLEQIIALVKVITEAMPSSLTSDGGLYVGSAGVAYMLYYISNYDPLHDNKVLYLQMAKSIYERDIGFRAKEHSSKADEVSFILGPAGLYVLGALLGKAMKNDALLQENISKYQACAKECLKPKFLSCGSDEFFVGRAGYLCGVHNLEKKIGIKVSSSPRFSA